MAVSKRVRYEVLRRDNHACRYCGATAPEAKLTVDHVVPVALGGGDGPDNLVTACSDCNAGKTSTTPDAPLVEDVKQDALRWSKAMEEAAELTRQREKHIRYITGIFDAFWCQFEFQGKPADRDAGWENSIAQFVALGLDEHDLGRLATAACQSQAPPWRKWITFCKWAWDLVKERQKIAQAIVQDQR